MDLIYFNPQQIRYVQEISNSIDAFGLPKIIEHGDYLKITIDSIKDLQNLAVFDSEMENLIAIAVYFREELSSFTLLHIAIDDHYNSINSENSNIFLAIISELKKNLSHIKGVNNLKILYSDKINYLRIK
ncbi:hypothetical protein MASR1M45_09510 [Candidatus Kapaibacterium sp.]